jgi:GxxExxY protein
MDRDEEKILFKELSYEIIGAAMEVHNSLGPGFSEKVYEEAFCIELETRKLAFVRQRLFDVKYKEIKVGEYVPDVVVDNKVLIELKAASEHNPLFDAQVFSYLKTTGLKLGILINFGTKKLTYKRIVH